MLGRLGEVFALNVYRGTEGLKGMLRMASGELRPDEMMVAQSCLMASFEDRDQLEKEDTSIIKQLGLKFRGAKAWPMFRTYDPGFVPWFLTGREQVVFLTAALEQASLLAGQHAKNPDALLPTPDGEYVVRVPETSGGVSTWTTRRLKPQEKARKASPVRTESTAVDELRLGRLHKAVQKLPTHWEVDLFHAPIPVGEGERPYYPLMLLIVDGHSGQILHAGMFEPWGERPDIGYELLELAERVQAAPRQVWALGEEVLATLEPVLRGLKIRGVVTDELPALEEARLGILMGF
nr:hypothetical protein [Paenibacillus flagellatus]